jgi:hypothetical protein
MTGLILKRAPIGWNQDDYDVLEDGVIVGRIFKVPIAPHDRTWDVGERPQRPNTPRPHGYEPMHEAAMAASWRQKIGFGRWAVEQRWPKR